MSKKTVSAFLAIALILSGCAGITDGEYSSSKPHASAENIMPETAQRTVEASGFDDLEAVVASFAEDHIEYGKIKFTAYEGDVQTDLASVCAGIPNNTPLGSYAVYYIGYNLNMIVSHYEADIWITYKRTSEELAAISRLESTDELDGMLMDAMDGHLMRVTFYCSDEAVTPAHIAARMSELYFDRPEQILYLPDAEISTYPKGGSPCIFEVSFTYPYSKQQTENRMESVSQSADSYLAGLDGSAGDEALRTLARSMAERVITDTERENREDYSKWYNVYTAYGALVMNRAAGEGYALAMKILCDRLGIECVVVRGRMNNVSHSWNIVRLEDGNYYHIDVSALTAGGGASEGDTPDEAPAPEDEPDVFFTDDEMSESYWWDSALYPECAGPSLQPEPPEPEAVPADAQETAPGEPEAVPDESESGETAQEPDFPDEGGESEAGENGGESGEPVEAGDGDGENGDENDVGEDVETPPDTENDPPPDEDPAEGGGESESP